MADVLGGSYQCFDAEDFVFISSVNKRVPLILRGVDSLLLNAVKRHIADLYGEGKTVYIFATMDGDGIPCLVDDIQKGFDYGILLEERLTERKRFDFSDLVEIMKRLRADDGCEWDKAQTHESIRINLIEEAYELVEAIDCKNADMMLEETGDVLLQSVFHTEIAESEGDFNFTDMLTALCRKLLDRHTHIFGENHANNAEEALAFWTAAKKKEKHYENLSDAMNRVPKNLPALLYAEKIQKIAKKGGFDWDDVQGPADKVGEELGELLNAPKETRTEEAGDLLFAVCNVLRYYKIDPEMALHGANIKFYNRFKTVEALATKDGKQMTDYTLDELDEFWAQAKQKETEK